jgi:protein-tyrosine phosphatase
MSLIYTHPTSRNSLYLGGKDDAKSLSKLQQRNVRRVLNVTPAKEAGITAGVPNYFEGKAGPGGYKIQYKRIGVYDASTSDMLSHADEIVNFISNGLHHGSVLVHCQRGVSRSATAVIMFLIR